jgi:hypothetical protein
MSTEYKYLRKINPDGEGNIIVRASGYVETINNPDSTQYELVEGSLPSNTVFEVIKTNQQLISDGRAAMLSVYQAAPIDLRSLFSDTITKINGLLDLQDYQLALVKANAVDTTIVTDPTLKTQADTIKAEFIAGLTQMQSL